MNIVNSGDRYMIYGEDVKTYKKLPAETYQVGFSPMSGFYLTLHNDLHVNEKIYGQYAKKVDKVLQTFRAFNRNMGVILSGPKGVGKSMFARMVAECGNKSGLPLIIVSDAFGGIEDFIASINQECIVLFDEFEKVFALDRETGENPQEALLPLFDGLDDGKKLFILTCNNVNLLDTCLLNRPGRFHYHFVLDTPTGDEVREYLEDNLEKDAKKYINKIVALSDISFFTYDVLRAIVFELNQGYGLVETLLDLNIERERYVTFDCRIGFTNGIIVKYVGLQVDMFENHSNKMWCRIDRKDIPSGFEDYISYVGIDFYTRDIISDDNGFHIDPSKVTVDWDADTAYIDMDTPDALKLKQDITEYKNGFTVSKVFFDRNQSKDSNSAFLHKYLV